MVGLLTCIDARIIISTVNEWKMTEKKNTLPVSSPVPGHTAGSSIPSSPRSLSCIDLTADLANDDDDGDDGDDEGPSSADKRNKLHDNQGWVEGNSIQNIIVDKRLLDDVPVRG